MVGRLTRRIYIYGLDGLVGMPENFGRFAAHNMREIKQLHAAPKKSTLPVSPLFGSIPSHIQESNPIHQSFSGNLAVMGVTYPPGAGSHPGASSLAPFRAVHKFSAEFCSHTRLIGLHGSCSA